MVGMSTSFDNPTPHGGPPFHGWKNGWGFGHSLGPGGYVGHPAIPDRLRCTPAGDRCFASSAFWRGRSEVGQAAGFGIGDRPDQGNPFKGYNVSPDNYGDVAKQLPAARKNAIRNISLKPRFPSMEEKYRDLSGPLSGPGPAKYDTSIPAGQGSWKNATAAPSWSMAGRQVVDYALIMSMRQPGPSEYTTRLKAGKNSPIRQSGSKALYDITCHEKLPSEEERVRSPGPARYMIKGHLDEYGLIDKILNVKPTRFTPKKKKRLPAMPRPEDYASQSLSSLGGSRTDVMEEPSPEASPSASPPRLARVDSSPY